MRPECSRFKALAGTETPKTKTKGGWAGGGAPGFSRTLSPPRSDSVSFSKPFRILLHFPRIDLPPVARLAGLLSLSPLPPGHSASDVSVGA